MKEDASRKEPSTSSQASKDLPEFKSEEVDKLRKELTELLTRNQLKPSTDDESERGKEGRASLLLDTDGAACANIKENLSSGDDDDFEPSTDTKIILARVRDLLADNMISGSRKTSLKLLLKKMFACHGGFVPTPNIKDPLPESRMEKILRALLHKKIYPHGSAQPVMKRFMNRRSAVKRYLESKPAERLRAEETKEKGEDSNKWVKTDSEYEAFVFIN
ncbi:uncharacterized protein A4U43_C03F13180 [Asparagus officinalis]|uniref:Uncharacterized protein n=1 Tax=Asparagus officinalis TaxID=4686 RepID=A0A5P1FCH9_ASPOF|nr:uncharacterized protein A4U43_C03F13180 [Asparagus officinalis]